MQIKIESQDDLRSFLIRERKRQKLTQLEVATKVGTSRTAIAEGERGIRDIQVNTLFRWLAALGCPMVVEGQK